MFWFGKKNTFNFSVSLFLQTVYMISVIMFFGFFFGLVCFAILGTVTHQSSIQVFHFLFSVYSVGVDDGGEK